MNEDSSCSLDGHGAGPNHSREEPPGVRGEDLHTWIVDTRTCKQMGPKNGGRVDGILREMLLEERWGVTAPVVELRGRLDTRADHVRPHLEER